jgi:outer membrane lipase/esterase
MKKLAISSVCALMLSPIFANADSSTAFNRLITLGDSLTDGGAYSGLPIAQSGGLAPNIKYKFTTNFSDGSAKVWAEYFAQYLNLPLTPNVISSSSNPAAFIPNGGTNYAQGGSQVAIDPSWVYTPYTPAISVKQQVTNLLAQSPSLSSKDLIVLWGGANDVFSAINSVGTIGPTQAAANVSQAATDLITQINRLKAAGATNIVVNGLPNMGLTPSALASGTAGSALATNLSLGVFNATLQQQLKGLNVIYVDSNKLFNDVVNNPVKYGFTAPNATTMPYNNCTNSLTCVIPVTNKAVANTYLFADGVHPSDASQAINGAAAYGSIQAVGQQATMIFGPSYAIRQQSIDLEPRLSPSALLKDDGVTKELRPVGDTQFWFGAGLGSFSNNSSQVSPSYSATTELGTVGIDRMVLSNALIGGAFTYSLGQSKFGNNTGSYNSQLALGTIYTTAFLSPEWYANAYVQYGSLNQSSISRTVNLGPTAITSSASADRGGSYQAAHIGVGYISQLSNWTITPGVGLTLAKTSMNSYDESNTPISLSYGDASYKNTLGTISVSGRMNGGFDQWLPFFRLAIDHDFDNSQMSVGVGPNSGLIANLSVDKPMTNFYNASVGVQRITKSGTFFFGFTGTAGDSLGTQGYSIAAGYKLPL